MDDELHIAYSKLLLTKAEICKDIVEAQDKATLAKVVEAKSRCGMLKGVGGGWKVRSLTLG